MRTPTKRTPTNSVATKSFASRFCTALILSALVWLSDPHGAQAGINEWTSNGPYGGNISRLVIDPQTPSTLYAGGFAGSNVAGRGALREVPQEHRRGRHVERPQHPRRL